MVPVLPIVVVGMLIVDALGIVSRAMVALAVMAVYFVPDSVALM